jgi:hypothetical protein
MLVAMTFNARSLCLTQAPNAGFDKEKQHHRSPVTRGAQIPSLAKQPVLAASTSTCQSCEAVAKGSLSFETVCAGLEQLHKPITANIACQRYDVWLVDYKLNAAARFPGLFRAAQARRLSRHRSMKKSKTELD